MSTTCLASLALVPSFSSYNDRIIRKLVIFHMIKSRENLFNPELTIDSASLDFHISSNLNIYWSIILSKDFNSMPLSATLLFTPVKGVTIYILVVGGSFWS